MLTDTANGLLKPKDTPYKVAEGEGTYVVLQTLGTTGFNFDYRLNGRRHTLILGRAKAVPLQLHSLA
jgi:hypothetical protein